MLPSVKVAYLNIYTKLKVEKFYLKNWKLSRKITLGIMLTVAFVWDCCT